MLLSQALPFVLLVSQAPVEPWPTAREARRRSLAGGQTHRYTVELARDIVASARLEQQGIDVVVDVRDPSGTLLLSFDAPTGDIGPEVAEWVSGDGGRFEVVVRPYVPDAVAGNYTLTVEAPRPATPRDRDLMGARREIARGYERRAVFDYGPARTAAERGLELMRSAVGEKAVEAADAYDLLGYVYDEIGLFDRGIDMFKKSLAIRQGAPAVRDVIVNDTENNLAWLELGGGYYADAEKRFRAVAERRDGAGGDEARRAENSRTGQGAALRRLGRYREAEEILRSVVSRADARPGANAGRNAWMARQLGLTLLDAGKPAEAEAVCSRTLAAPRPDRWSVVARSTDLSCLAAARAAQGRAAEAEPLFVEALDICARERGADSLCAADVLEEQGRAAARAGQAARAREALERAARIRSAVLPATHPEVVQVRGELEKLAAKGR